MPSARERRPARRDPGGWAVAVLRFGLRAQLVRLAAWTLLVPAAVLGTLGVDLPYGLLPD